MSARRRLTLAWIVAFCGAATAAADTVELAAASAPRGRTKVSGRVLEYTGRQLVLELAGGRTQEFPGPRVLRVETDYGPDQVAADRLFTGSQYAEALPLYRQAVDREKRVWVKRLILARMVWCYQALGQAQPAGEVFLLLLQSDPSTPYFDCIPLAWVPAQPPPLLAQTAGAWLARDERQEPAAVLLGASHLLPTAKRPEALAKLQRLVTNADKRIARLALAQTWLAAANPDDEQLAGWQRAVDEMPEPLRAGPYFALGRGYLARQRWEDAALALMRIPILYPRHVQLAARSLLEAGVALERLGRPRQAARLYRELLRSYPESRPAAEARGRVKEMAGREG